MYIRKKTYSIECVYEAIKDVLFEKKKIMIDFDGDMIKANSQRYQTFFTNGLTCKCCGIKGIYFVKEKDKNQSRYHLNLYAVNKDGKEILMTKDHIIPVSKGGKNILSNYQTMCCVCNERKANR